MGAGVLPFCFINGKLNLLFGKERDIDENPGWSDFGGGTDPGETYLETAARECSEEISGFLGSTSQIKSMLKKNGYINVFLPNPQNIKKGYMVFLTPIDYDEKLVEYFNIHQAFIHKKMDKQTIKKSKLFEKTEIKWFPVSTLKKNKNKFRNFYKKIVQILIDNEKVLIQDCKKLISK